MNFCQCLMSKNNLFQTSWIPERFAKVGKILKLRENGVWDNGWKVETVGTPREESKVPDYRSLIRSHQTATGDRSK